MGFGTRILNILHIDTKILASCLTQYQCLPVFYKAGISHFLSLVEPWQLTVSRDRQETVGGRKLSKLDIKNCQVEQSLLVCFFERSEDGGRTELLSVPFIMSRIFLPIQHIALQTLHFQSFLCFSFI